MHGLRTRRHNLMRTEGIDIDFRFIEDIQDVEGIRRIVIRVSEGNIIVTGSEDSQLRYFLFLHLLNP